MNDAFWRYAGAALAAGGMLLGVGRYVGNLETRIQQLEQRELYIHGTFKVPHQEQP